MRKIQYDKEEFKKRISKKFRKSIQREILKKQRRSGIADNVKPNHIKKARKEIKIAEALDLEDNYDKTIDLLDEIYKKCSKHINIKLDFKDIKKISIDAGLLLIARLDACIQTRKQKWPVKIIASYPDDKYLRKQLTDMGFYDFFGMRNPQDKDNDCQSLYINYESLNVSDSVKIGKYLEKLSLNQEKKEEKLMYEAAIEAMNNSSEHAYAEKNGFKEQYPNHESRWWVCGKVDYTNKKLIILFYDNGVGIPETMEKKWGFIGTDEDLIEKAFILGKSSTNKPYRGRGLPLNIKGAATRWSKDASLTIYSNRGKNKYDKRSLKKDISSKSSNSRSIQGTLIKWEFNF